MKIAACDAFVDLHAEAKYFPSGDAASENIS